MIQKNKETVIKLVKQCTDYKGIQYDSVTEMCKEYGVSPDTYRMRKKHGYTQEQALTGSTVKACKVECEDFNGKRFSSIREMCKYHGVSFQTYNNRRKKGYTLRQCLTGDNLGKPTRLRRYIDAKTNTVRYGYKDHEGRQFDSVKSMCAYHKISTQTYFKRKRLGYPLKECLDNHVYTSKKCIDHNGQEFSSISAMCRYYDIKPQTYRHRRKMGLTIEQSLLNKGKIKYR